MEGGFVLFQVLIVLTLMDAIMPCTCQFLNWVRPVPPARMLQRVLYISNVAGGPVMNKLPLPPSSPLSLPIALISVCSYIMTSSTIHSSGWKSYCWWHILSSFLVLGLFLGKLRYGLKFGFPDVDGTERWRHYGGSYQKHRPVGCDTVWSGVSVKRIRWNKSSPPSE